MIDNWTLRKRPARLERRIDFDNFELTREFLDLAADVSEQEGFYPDMNFGRNHVSMTIQFDGEDGSPAESQLRFAKLVNGFAPTNQISSPLVGQCVAQGN